MTKNLSTKSNPHIKRRDFLGKLAISSVTGVGFLSLIGSIDFSIPRFLVENTSFKVGRLVDFPLNVFTFIKDKNLFIYRDRIQVKALSAVCTHLGCVVKKIDSGFECPCHGSSYDQEGKILKGPAPRSLEWLMVELSRDGQIMVDSQRKVSENEALQI
jgi:cytochrome b6-f complex iron-sulfur subunit